MTSLAHAALDDKYSNNGRGTSNVIDAVNEYPYSPVVPELQKPRVRSKTWVQQRDINEDQTLIRLEINIGEDLLIPPQPDVSALLLRSHLDIIAELHRLFSNAQIPALQMDRKFAQKLVLGHPVIRV